MQKSNLNFLLCPPLKNHEMGHVEDLAQAPNGQQNHQEIEDPFLAAQNDADQTEDKTENENEEDPKWWDDESQYLLNSQQLVEGLSLCDELLRSQSPNRGENENGELKVKSCLSDYAILGPEYLKKDLIECQDLVLDAANIELDTPPEFRLSQIVCSVIFSPILLCLPSICFVFFFSPCFCSDIHFFKLRSFLTDEFLLCFSLGVWISGEFCCLGWEQGD